MTDKNQDDIEKKEIQPDAEETAEAETVQSGEISEPDEENIELTEQDTDTVGEIGNIFMGSASTTLSTLLKQKVAITAPKVELVKKIDEIIKPEKDDLIVEINYTQGLKGKVMLVVKKQEASIIADIMNKGTGMPETETEMDDIKISAVQEAMNQMVGNASIALSTMLNRSITISPPDIKTAENFTDLPSEKFVSIKFNFKIGDLAESELYQFMSVSQAKTQVNEFTEVMKGMTEQLKNNSAQSIVDDLAQKEKSFKEENTVKAGVSAGHEQFGRQQNQQGQVTVQPVQFSSFDNSNPLSGNANQNLNLVMDVNLGLTVELGKAELPIKNVLELTRGSIIELDKIAGEPVELYANGKLIAKGEVVVIEDNFGLRITSIISPEQRIKHL